MKKSHSRMQPKREDMQVGDRLMIAIHERKDVLNSYLREKGECKVDRKKAKWNFERLMGNGDNDQSFDNTKPY